MRLPILALMPALLSLAGRRTSPMCRMIVLSGPMGKDAILDGDRRQLKMLPFARLAQSSGSFLVASLEFADHVAASCSIFSHRSNVDWVTLNV